MNKIRVLIIFASVSFFSKCLLAQKEAGRACILQIDGSPGKCISKFNCQYAKELFKLGQKPQRCTIHGAEDLVCCKKTQLGKIPGQISNEKCRDYYDFHNAVQPRSLGQLLEKPRIFKHMAAIGHKDKKDIIRWFCGGALISENFVLVAAHCVTTTGVRSVNIIRLGELDLKNTTDDATPYDMKVASVHVHPGYKPPQFYNDIALLELATIPPLGLYIKPACLNTAGDLASGKFIVTSWNPTVDTGNASNNLQETRVDIVSQSDCNQRYSPVVPKKRLPLGIVEESQICAGDVQESETCPINSGGPLQEEVETSGPIESHYRIIGLSSFWKACNSVEVYTRVSAYLDWIETIVWPDYWL